jgi:phage shock protein E
MSLKSVPEIVAEKKNHLRCLDPDTASQMLEAESDPLIIDVREPGEVDQKKARSTVHIPRGVLEMKIAEHTTDPDRPIFVHCASGGRATLAAASLQDMGFENVHVLNFDCDQVIAQLGSA